MSHFSYRHCKSSSTIPAAATPTIRVTSPIPDAISVIDIWDPEVSADLTVDVVSHPHKSYTFCFAEEEEEEAEQQQPQPQQPPPPEAELSTTATSRGKIQIRPEAASVQHFSDCGQLADVVDVGAGAEALNSSQSDDDGLRTTGDSDNSSVADEADEHSQMSTSTQIQAPRQPQAAGMRSGPKQVKFTRSLSLVPCGSDSCGSTKPLVSVLSIQGRCYSSLDSSAALPDVIIRFPSVEQRPDASQSGSASGGGEEGGGGGGGRTPPTSPAVTVDLLDRVDAMKDDVELLDVANDFVFQLLQMAHDEIERQRRQQQMEQKGKLSLDLQHVAVPHRIKRNPWYRRLRRLLLRSVTCTCIPTYPNIQSPLT